PGKPPVAPRRRLVLVRKLGERPRPAVWPAARRAGPESIDRAGLRVALPTDGRRHLPSAGRPGLRRRRQARPPCRQLAVQPELLDELRLREMACRGPRVACRQPWNTRPCTSDSASSATSLRT